MVANPDQTDSTDFGLIELEHTLSRLGRLLRRIRIPSSYLNRDIDINSFWQLSPLRQNKTMRPSEIAAQLALDNSTISRQLQKLEAQGLIERTIDPSDARAHLVTLTQDGAQILDIVSSARREMIATVISRWNENDISSLLFYLSKFTDELEAEL